MPDSIDDILIVSLLIVSGYFIATIAIQSTKAKTEWVRPLLTVYFALLGIGFFLAEVALIQYFRLLIGDPILSFTASLGALLFGAGIGSWFGQRFELSQIPRSVGIVALGIMLWLGASSIIYPQVVDATLMTPLVVRILVTIVVLLPLGFLLGVPFPAGLQLAHHYDASGVPLFWGMNALASTLGAVLATVLALVAGFQSALIVGAGLYLIVALLMLLVWKRVT